MTIYYLIYLTAAPISFFMRFSTTQYIHAARPRSLQLEVISTFANVRIDVRFLAISGSISRAE